jgi:hypothetical protein
MQPCPTQSHRLLTHARVTRFASLPGIGFAQTRQHGFRFAARSNLFEIMTATMAPHVLSQDWRFEAFR